MIQMENGEVWACVGITQVPWVLLSDDDDEVVWVAPHEIEGNFTILFEGTDNDAEV